MTKKNLRRRGIAKIIPFRCQLCWAESRDPLCWQSENLKLCRTCLEGGLLHAALHARELKKEDYKKETLPRKNT